MSRILLIEDNANLTYGLSTSLGLEGHCVEIAADGISGLRMARKRQPDLIILDLTLPGMDGYRVLAALRAEGDDVPVIVLTARGEEADKVLGFGTGADDYVTKPFGLHELLARIGALLRRARSASAGDQARTTERFGDVEIDMRTRTVRRLGQPVALAPKEYALLLALLRRNGAIASRLELLQEVWGHRAVVITRTVDMHIAELRRKLERNPRQPRHILTVRKAGYRLERNPNGTRPDPAAAP